MNDKYKVVWESNSRSKRLASQGEINKEDIRPKCRTSDFPKEAATVRMANLANADPSVTIHIRDRAQSKTYWSGSTSRSYEVCPVLRVELRKLQSGNVVMNFSGNTYTLDMSHVSFVVDYVKAKMRY